MTGNLLWKVAAVGLALAITSVAWAQDDSRPPSIDYSVLDGEPIESTEPAPVQPTALPLDPDTVFQRVIVGGDRGQVSGQSERLIYSNTLGSFKTNFPNNQPVSDDIAITAPNGCKLTRYRFKVLGKVNPAATGGPYTVTYGLYSNCPLAVGSTNATRDLVKITGTDGVLSFDDDAPREIEHVIDPESPVALPTNFYLSLRFNRLNCGTVLGAPALVGFSGDVWDFPGFPCNGALGGFPQFPHASYWAEFYGDADCLEARLAYKSERPTNTTGGTSGLGANIQGVDDVRLFGGGCNMVAYEVTVRGVGFYTFDLRESCFGSVIPGTQKFLSVSSTTQLQLHVARFTFDPPIPIPEQVWLGFKSSSNSGGAVIAGIEPHVGRSDNQIYFHGPNGCFPTNPTQGIHGAVNASIICGGAPPLGACCDHAEAVCREVPQINCFDCASIPSDPDWCQWIEGTACDPDPFAPGCGLSACCKPDDTCEDLTRNQCMAAEPLDLPREWHFLQLCEDEVHECDYTACLVGEGDCLAVHPGTGCENLTCCRNVCDFDEYCCLVEWDSACLRWADSFCPGAASNNQCAAPTVGSSSGAFDLLIPGVFYGTNTYATVSDFDPGFCCHQGTGRCLGGCDPGRECLSDLDCTKSGTCINVEPQPGRQGYATVWHKFVATHTTAKISTCGSKAWDERFADSLLQVFAAQDLSSPTATCNSLSVIACNDDAGPLCPAEPHNAALCVGGLVPGNTYYVLLASNLIQHQGLYRITTSAPCTPQAVPGDSCFDAIEVTDGNTPFDTAGATFDCPAASCTPNARNDLWYDYTATCTGQVTFSACVDGDPAPNLVAYSGCTTCPRVSNNSSSLACGTEGGASDCTEPAAITLPVAFGDCLKLRLADTFDVSISGDLHIACQSGDCQPNGISDNEDILNCAPEDLACKDCNGNTVPDGCDIRDDRDLDLNLNGKLDSCEPCPAGFISLLVPPANFLDARRPANHAHELEGVSEARLAAFPGAQATCWSLCETSVNVGMHPPYEPDLVSNDIVAVTEDPLGHYLLKFKRPITPGEATFVRYTDDDGNVSTVRLMAHPANVDGNALTNSVDILVLIDVLNGIKIAPWGLLSTDCDHSGVTAPADLICVIDLLNAGWSGTVRPSAAGCP